MYAHVLYLEDQMEAILPVRLIRQFRPTSIYDFDKSAKLAYWKAEDGTDEDYYRARVLMLGSKYILLLKTTV